jgi:PrcB C-terminal
MPTTQRKIVTLTVMLSLLVLSGCETPQEMPYQTMDLAMPVDILHSVVGGHPALKEPGLKLITSQAQLDALGVDGLIGRDVDFNNESVVLATLGEMPTAGYWINITAVNQEGDLLQVYGQANRPAADAMAGQVLTYPYCAVVIQRTSATTVRDQIDSVEDEDPPM